jgi:small redox-active disulfide protein 2
VKDIKVLGPGCHKCKTTARLLEEAAKERGVEITLEKVEDVRQITAHGVMSTPAVVIDGKVVHSGGVPSREQVESWL